MKPLRPFYGERQGMTLLELLVVTAIVGLMAVLAVPAFVSIAQGSGMKRAIGSVTDILERARTEAMAQSTWVLVGISPDTTTTPLNLTIMTVASRDGTTNTTAANLQPLAKPIRVDNVKLLDSPTTWASNAVLLKDSQFQFTGTVAGKPRNFAGAVIAFSPQGEAVIKTASLSPWIEIPLRELRGTTEIDEKTASIRVSGPSGQVVVSY